jgi:multiple sugar transport system substrate-binding protein
MEVTPVKAEKSQHAKIGASSAQAVTRSAGKRQRKPLLTRRTALAALGGLAATSLAGRPARASTTLRMWTFLDPVKGKTSREHVLKQLIDKFEAANPGAKIVVEPQNWQAMSEKFFAAHQTGTAPDIPTLISSRLHGAIKLGSLANLDDLFFKTWPQDEKDDIEGPIWNYGASPNAHYQVAITTSIWGLTYRADLLREAGIDPKSLTTWDALIEAAQRVMKKDDSGAVARWGIGQTNAGLTPNPPFLLNALLEEKGTIFDDKFRAVWSTPAGVKGLQMQADMIRKYKIMAENQINLSNEEVTEQYMAGRIVFHRTTTARWLQCVARFGPGSIGYLPTPSFSGSKPSPSEMNAWCIGVWSGSKHKELAGKFLELMATKEADTLWSTVAGQLPNRKSTIANNRAFFDDPNNSILITAADDIRKSGWLPPEGAGEGGWTESFCTAFQDVMTNNADPKAALQKVETAFNRMRRR